MRSPPTESSVPAGTEVSTRNVVTDVTAEIFTERLEEETLTEYEARTMNRPQYALSVGSLKRQAPLFRVAAALRSYTVAGYLDIQSDKCFF
jgi:hypothetical protein